MNHEKRVPGLLGYIGQYATQLYRDLNKPLYNYIILYIHGKNTTQLYRTPKTHPKDQTCWGFGPVVLIADRLCRSGPVKSDPHGGKVMTPLSCHLIPGTLFQRKIRTARMGWRRVDEWLFMIVYDCLWLFMIVYDCLLLFMIVYDCCCCCWWWW